MRLFYPALRCLGQGREATTMATRDIKIEDFVGLTFEKIDGMVDGSREIVFWTVDGRKFVMGHEQDCCENVRLVDLDGEVENLIGTPIVYAYMEVGNLKGPNHVFESMTWTFYRLGGMKGGVTLRWLGESNGYYSESVDIVKCN